MKRDPIHGLTEAEANEIMPNGKPRVQVDETGYYASVYCLDKLQAYERGRNPAVLPTTMPVPKSKKKRGRHVDR